IQMNYYLIQELDIVNDPIHYYMEEAMKRVQQIIQVQGLQGEDIAKEVILNNARFLAKNMATVFEERVYDRYFTLKVDKRDATRQTTLAKFQGDVQKAIYTYVAALR